MLGSVQQRAQFAYHGVTCALLLSERELEKQRESTASDILQKKQEAEAAVSVPLPLCRVQTQGGLLCPLLQPIQLKLGLQRKPLYPRVNPRAQGLLFAILQPHCLSVTCGHVLETLVCALR